MPSDEPQFYSRDVGIPPELRFARYVRIQLTADDEHGKLSKQPLRPQKISFENLTTIGANEAETKVAKIDRCIYCDSIAGARSNGTPLTNEHIVARGWGGTLVLEAASCSICQKHINEEIEGILLGGTFLALRRHLKIRSRKRRGSSGREVFDVLTLIDGKIVKTHLPLDEHPTILFMLVFNPPRVIAGAGGPATLYINEFESFGRATKYGLDNIMSQGFDTVRFSQMLAKIAHCYAVWKVGAHAFFPFLREFILRKFGRAEQYPECYDLIGGSVVLADRSAPEILHELGHQIVTINGRRLLVVNIRLLSNINGPIYTVVVGEMV